MVNLGGYLDPRVYFSTPARRRDVQSTCGSLEQGVPFRSGLPQNVQSALNRTPAVQTAFGTFLSQLHLWLADCNLNCRVRAVISYSRTAVNTYNLNYRVRAVISCRVDWSTPTTLIAVLGQSSAAEWTEWN